MELFASFGWQCEGWASSSLVLFSTDDPEAPEPNPDPQTLELALEPLVRTAARNLRLELIIRDFCLFLCILELPCFMPRLWENGIPALFICFIPWPFLSVGRLEGLGRVSGGSGAAPLPGVRKPAATPARPPSRPGGACSVWPSTFWFYAACCGICGGPLPRCNGTIKTGTVHRTVPVRLCLFVCSARLRRGGCLFRRQRAGLSQVLLRTQGQAPLFQSPAHQAADHAVEHGEHGHAQHHAHKAEQSAEEEHGEQHPKGGQTHRAAQRSSGGGCCRRSAGAPG